MSAGVEELVQVDPATLVIGRNIRTDTHIDAKEFSASIKARGVLEVITAYRDEEGSLIVLRGQRRTLVAAQVGTPSGTVTVRVVPAPEEADRIIDQMGENVHRAAIREREVRDAIEQLALCGVSAAQIAKRTAIKRSTVNAALTVVSNESTRARMDANNLTLDHAAIFAEFENNEQAVEKLTNALRFNRPLEHAAQQLRDDAAEAAERAAEAERLRNEGLPALDSAQAPADLWRVRLSDLRDSEGQPVPEEEWPNVPGAAVVVVQVWEHPETDGEDEDEDPDEHADAVQVFDAAWICTDPKAANLHHKYDSPNRSGSPAAEQDEASREAQRAERRTVIDNNKAWKSAEAVRREWLTGFVTRKTAPKGAESLICEAILTGHHTLTKALQNGHPMLCNLLGAKTPEGYHGTRATCERLAASANTPKAATMLTLASVIAAWEDSTGTHTWRNPTPWDARIMTALTEWGYTPSEVEALLTSDGAASKEPVTVEDRDEPDDAPAA
jgi:ParB family chromosome partitioning protein